MERDRADDRIREAISSGMEAYFKAEPVGDPTEEAFAAAGVAPEGPSSATWTLWTTESASGYSSGCCVPGPPSWRRTCLPAPKMRKVARVRLRPLRPSQGPESCEGCAPAKTPGSSGCGSNRTPPLLRQFVTAPIRRCVRKLLSRDFTFVMVASLLLKVRFRTYGVQMSNLESPGGALAVRRSGLLPREVAKPASFQPVSPSRHGLGEWWLGADRCWPLRGCRRTRSRKRLLVRKDPVALPTR